MTSYSRPNHSPLHSFEYFKVPDIVNSYTCLFLYDHFRVVKSSNFILSLLSEQYSYTTRNASSDQLYIPFSHSKKNIRKFYLLLSVLSLQKKFSRILSLTVLNIELITSGLLCYTHLNICIIVVLFPFHRHKY